MSPKSWTTIFREARQDGDLAVLEGFHPLKHAIWCGAEVLHAVTDGLEGVRRLSEHFSPDLSDRLEETTTLVSEQQFRRLLRDERRTEVLAIARKPKILAEALLSAKRSAPLVLLEAPTHHGNIGAAVRVAASAGAAGVVTTGTHDPWDEEALRGSAGLHFALPVARTDTLGEYGGPLVAFEPDGEELRPGVVPSDAILAFGSERRGLSDELLAHADQRVRIPMEPPVSSMNLASAVAVAVYAWRFGL
jgi:TrmH family RNA methyltransferase